MTKWHMRISCWIAKTTSTHSEYVVLTAFPLQQQLHELASLLHYKYIAGHVTSISITFEITQGNGVVGQKKKKLISA
jgi:hypothetical protein